MRWFTRSRSRTTAYAKHLTTIRSRLPADLWRLATDPRLNLHDGRFRRVEIDIIGRRATLVVDTGDIEVGYRRLTLGFEAATVIPNDYRALALAIRAEFQSTHWNAATSVTEVRAQEVDVLSPGRYVLRLLLYPFHEFAIEFEAFSLSEERLDGRPRARPGSFVMRATAGSKA